MTPVEQTLFGGPEAEVPGNCLTACVASVLELPLGDVPHFVVYGDWWARFVGFMREHRLGVWDCPLIGGIEPRFLQGDRPGRIVDPPGYWIAAVLSPRLVTSKGHPALHSVVMHGAKVVWDPHPQSDMGHLGFVEAALLVPCGVAA